MDEPTAQKETMVVKKQFIRYMAFVSDTWNVKNGEGKSLRKRQERKIRLKCFMGIFSEKA